MGGTGKETGKRHPTLRDNVMVSAGAKLLGSFTVGKNAKIGAGSVVLKAVPPDTTVVGVPGMVVKTSHAKISTCDLNHADLPDPIMDCISNLQQTIEELAVRIGTLEQWNQSTGTGLEEYWNGTRRTLEQDEKSTEMEIERKEEN